MVCVCLCFCIYMCVCVCVCSKRVTRSTRVYTSILVCQRCKLEAFCWILRCNVKSCSTKPSPWSRNSKHQIRTDLLSDKTQKSDKEIRQNKPCQPKPTCSRQLMWLLLALSHDFVHTRRVHNSQKRSENFDSPITIDQWEKVIHKYFQSCCYFIFIFF